MPPALEARESPASGGCWVQVLQVLGHRVFHKEAEISIFVTPQMKYLNIAAARSVCILPYYYCFMVLPTGYKGASVGAVGGNL